MPRPLVFLLPGPIDTPTGGFVFDRHVIEGCRAAGLAPSVLIAPGRHPHPDDAAIEETGRMVGDLADGTVLVVDGLCLTPIARVLAPHADRLSLVALIHHPLADETGVPEQSRPALLADEAAILARCTRVIATSRTTADRLIAALSVPSAKISVVRPGVDAVAELKPVTPDSADDRSLRLLSVGTLIPRKGHDLLVEALGGLMHLDWHLDLVGEARDPAFAAMLRDRIREAGLEDRITLHGAVEQARLDAFYRAADLFVLASRHEGFGIAYLEAVRWGLPVLGTTAGAIPEAVPEAARLLVEPDSVEALRAGLRGLIDDKTARLKLAEGARAAAPNLRVWSDVGREFATLMRGLNMRGWSDG